MQVGKISQSVSFGRALTTKEQKEYSKVINEAKKELGLDKTSATIFDFSFPSGEKNTGIGTSFSPSAQELAGFLKTMCGINSIQLQPQGQISNYIRSPYSGTGFSLGMHIIDLNKLADKKYGSLLSAEDLDSDYMNRTHIEDSADYDNVFSSGGQKAMLQKAYENFTHLKKTSSLKKEFEAFKKENSFWVEKDALFDACAAANGSNDMRTWSERDKNVFATKEGDKARIEELKNVVDEKGNNVVDFEEFVQFIADKQQKESKQNYNKQGIDVYGDCQIGFSAKDFWAHKSAFYPDYEFGCDIGNGQYSCWSPAIDFNKLNSDAGELLYNKFNLFFKRYDGVRIDAAWQLINPLICLPEKENGHDKFDSNGNKLGRKISNQPVIGHGGKEIIQNIILKAADKNNVSHDKIFLELLGGNSYDSLDAVKGLGTSLIHITRYGSDSWGRVKYYESKGNNKYQNMNPGDYIIGPGTHDDISLIEQVKNGKNKADYLSKDLHLSKHELENHPSKLSDAMFGELFTTSCQFATLPDILGSDRRINTPNTVEGNWSYRVSPDYEREYFTNLAQSKGLNLPQALSIALKAKNNGKSSSLTDKLNEFAFKLTQNGPMTTKEADKLNIKG